MGFVVSPLQGSLHSSISTPALSHRLLLSLTLRTVKSLRGCSCPFPGQHTTSQYHPSPRVHLHQAPGGVLFPTNGAVLGAGAGGYAVLSCSRLM